MLQIEVCSMCKGQRPCDPVIPCTGNQEDTGNTEDAPLEQSIKPGTERESLLEHPCSHDQSREDDVRVIVAGEHEIGAMHEILMHHDKRCGNQRQGEEGRRALCFLSPGKNHRTHEEQREEEAPWKGFHYAGRYDIARS